MYSKSIFPSSHRLVSLTDHEAHPSMRVMEYFPKYTIITSYVEDCASS